MREAVGTADPLLDDSLFLALRWRAAGNEAELALYPESLHGFTLFPTTMARAANDRIEGWVAARGGLTPPGGGSQGATRVGVTSSIG
jgi:acetyl esterase/lipase